MTPKGLLELLIKSYEQNLNFIIQKFNRFFPQRKLLKKFIDGKGVSATQKRIVFFQKKSIEKAIFHLQKYEKYTKYKNYLKRLVGAFFLILYPIMIPSGPSEENLHCKGQSPEFEFFR